MVTTFTWAPFPFVRYALALGTGMGLFMATGCLPSLAGPLFGGLSLLFALLTFAVTTPARRRLAPATGLVGLAALVVAGMLLAGQRTQARRAGHLTNLRDTVLAYRAVVSAVVEAREKSYRTEAEVRAVRTRRGWQTANGKVLVTVRRDAPRPTYGDVWLVRGSPQAVAPPANPGEFDYRQYLAAQHLHFRHYLRPGEYLTLGNAPPNALVQLATRARHYAEAVITRRVAGTREAAVANALVLGVRDELDDEIMRAYATSGAMHVLSVSGLHVGILFVVLAFGLGGLRRGRYGNWLFAVVVLGILWFYAFVTALSPSVLRSVTMFSFLVIGEATRRKPNVYNTLALSAVLLLVWEPYYLLSVGFQLSYLAVFGLVLLVPGLERLLSVPDPHADYRRWDCWKKLRGAADLPKLGLSLVHYAVQWLWRVTCASVAAQLATFPLAVYYFHQFPTYFLLSNPAVLLFSGWVLLLGLALVVVGWVPGVGAGVGALLDRATWLLNEAAFGTERLPLASLARLNLTATQVGLVYLLLILLGAMGYFRRPRLAWASLGVALTLAGTQVAQAYAQRQQHALIFHQVRRQSVVSLVASQWATTLADAAFLTDRAQMSYYLENGYVARGVAHTRPVPWLSNDPRLAWRRTGSYGLLVWRGLRVLVVSAPLDRRGDEVAQKLSVDYALVQHGAVRQLSDLTRTVAVGCLVLDGSNRPYQAARLRQQSAAAGIRCHDTSLNGALTVEMP